jgi:hypothetical protein
MYSIGDKKATPDELANAAKYQTLVLASNEGMFPDHVLVLS